MLEVVYFDLRTCQWGTASSFCMRSGTKTENNFSSPEQTQYLDYQRMSCNCESSSYLKHTKIQRKGMQIERQAETQTGTVTTERVRQKKIARKRQRDVHTRANTWCLSISSYESFRATILVSCHSQFITQYVVSCHSHRVVHNTISG